MFDTLRKAARALQGPTQRERELSYLNGAQDRLDLEYRERQVERGLFRQRGAFPL